MARDRFVAVRMAGTGADRIQQRAEQEAAGNQSEMIRRLLAYAIARMPEGWTPK